MPLSTQLRSRPRSSSRLFDLALLILLYFTSFGLVTDRWLDMTLLYVVTGPPFGATLETAKSQGSVRTSKLPYTGHPTPGDPGHGPHCLPVAVEHAVEQEESSTEGVSSMDEFESAL